MLYRNTKIHSNHNSMICSCEQCQQARNVSTAILPHLDKQTSTNAFIAEVVVGIDSETGRKRVYFWPIPPRYQAL
jgi:hypothetical protein